MNDMIGSISMSMAAVNGNAPSSISTLAGRRPLAPSYHNHNHNHNHSHNHSHSRSHSNMSSRRPSHSGGPETLTSPPIMESADASAPLRHPHPMTTAELHLELEREQEAVVNRLTRELSVLRAQHSASVTSNASQGSAISNTPISDAALSLTHTTPTRQHRSSSTASASTRQHRSCSNASNRSLNTNAPSTANASVLPPSNQHQSTAPLAGVSQASFDRAAAVGGAVSSASATGGSISRQPSIRSASGTSTPALHRPSVTHAMSSISQAGSFVQPSHINSNPASPYTTPSATSADIATARAELELVKTENEALRQRVKALERTLRSRRSSIHSELSVQREPSLTRPSVSAWAAATSATAGASVAGPRERSESQSTTASFRRPETLEREDSIRVGESAATTGLGLRN